MRAGPCGHNPTRSGRERRDYGRMVRSAITPIRTRLVASRTRRSPRQRPSRTSTPAVTAVAPRLGSREPQRGVAVTSAVTSQLLDLDTIVWLLAGGTLTFRERRPERPIDPAPDSLDVSLGCPPRDVRRGRGPAACRICGSPPIQRPHHSNGRIQHSGSICRMVCRCAMGPSLGQATSTSFAKSAILPVTRADSAVRFPWCGYPSGGDHLSIGPHGCGHFRPAVHFRPQR